MFLKNLLVWFQFQNSFLKHIYRVYKYNNNYVDCESKTLQNIWCISFLPAIHQNVWWNMIVFVWNITWSLYCSKWHQRLHDSSFRLVTPSFSTWGMSDYCTTVPHDTSRAFSSGPLPQIVPGWGPGSRLATKGRWSFFCRNPLTFQRPSPALLHQTRSPPSVQYVNMKQSPASVALALLWTLFLLCSDAELGLNTHDLANLWAPIFTADNRKAKTQWYLSNLYNHTDKQEMASLRWQWTSLTSQHDIFLIQSALSFAADTTNDRPMVIQPGSW